MNIAQITLPGLAKLYGQTRTQDDRCNIHSDNHIRKGKHKELDTVETETISEVNAGVGK